MSITFKQVAHHYIWCDMETGQGQGKLCGVDNKDKTLFACVYGIGWVNKAKPYLKRLPEGAAPTCDMAAQGYDCHGLIDAGEAIEVEVWNPKKGEVCWFWDDIIVQPRISIYDSNGSKYSTFRDKEGSEWQHCAPFTGELPEYWKKKWEVKP